MRRKKLTLKNSLNKCKNVILPHLTISGRSYQLTAKMLLLLLKCCIDWCLHCITLVYSFTFETVLIISFKLNVFCGQNSVVLLWHNTSPLRHHQLIRNVVPNNEHLNLHFSFFFLGSRFVEFLVLIAVRPSCNIRNIILLVASDQMQGSAVPCGLLHTGHRRCR